VRYASDFHTEIPELATFGFSQNHVDSSTEMGDFVGFHFGSNTELGASTLHMLILGDVGRVFDGGV
jgi:hypothetical protein